MWRGMYSMREDPVLDVDRVLEDARDQRVALVDDRAPAGQVVGEVGRDRDGHPDAERDRPASAAARGPRASRGGQPMPQDAAASTPIQRQGDRQARDRGEPEEQADGERPAPVEGQQHAAG